ncbi:hypothetical protein XENORESO_008678 [Xenotaenia resolanae]|uniref:Uncharacterized protein n=1 Tax=Xenotaenia resolanae TaxID=208358 RepID=A0ABV0X338_9TELE
MMLNSSHLGRWPPLGVQSAVVRPQYLYPPLGERASDQGLATRVEQLSTELTEMKSLLQSRHSDASLPTAGLSSPPMPDLSVEEDVLSLAASASKFRDEEEAQSSPAFETGSFSSQSAVGEPSDGSMREVMCMALRQLQLELPLGEVSATGSAFFRHGRAPTPFSVPLSGVPEGNARLLAEPESIVVSLRRWPSVGCHARVSQGRPGPYASS